MERDRVGCLEQAAALLPPPWRQRVLALPPEQRDRAEELRLRVGQPLYVNLGGGETPVGAGQRVTESDLRLTLEIASQASAHTVLEQVKNGFLTVRGGHRVGICGTVVLRDGRVESMRHLTSLNIRVAREVRGAADGLLPALLEEGDLCNTLILAPPGAGKTTLLRDLIRGLSGGGAAPPLRVGVADERGELGAVHRGQPQMDLGPHTDILDGCPKGAAAMLLLRGMNPQVLAMDEITAPEDVAALLTAAGCGVSLLATAHGRSPGELKARPLYRRLLEERLFQRFIVAENRAGRRTYRVWKEGESSC